MLLYLNDDCLLEICKYLDVFDRISLANASQRLASTVQESYRGGHFETTLRFWHYIQEHKDMFDYFWKLVSENLQKFILRPSEADHVNLLQHCRLPSLKEFSFSSIKIKRQPPTFELTSFLAANCMNLERLKLEGIDWSCFLHLQRLGFPKLTRLEILEYPRMFRVLEGDFRTEMFPKLTTLILIHVPMQNNILRFTKVTELALIDCRLLKSQHLEHIITNFPLKKLTLFYSEGGLSSDIHEDDEFFFETKKFYQSAQLSNCQSLEELTLSYHYFCMFVDELPHLKKLRKLRFALTAECSCFSRIRPMSTDIIRLFGEVVQKLTIVCSDLKRYETELLPFFSYLKKAKCLKTFRFPCTLRNLITIARDNALSKLKDYHVYGVLRRKNLHDFEYNSALGLLDQWKKKGNINFFNSTYDDRVDLDFYADELVKSGLNVGGNYNEMELPLVFRFEQAANEIKFLHDFYLDGAEDGELHSELDFTLEM